MDKTLEGFYQWTILLGHYSATEAVERYRQVIKSEEKKDVTDETRTGKGVNAGGTG